MKLVSVYDTYDSGVSTLYALLREREAGVSISHRMPPTILQHREFVVSRPYEGWYFIEAADDYVGAIYLTKQDEIGVFVFKEHRGFGWGRQAVKQLMLAHPRERYLANINPDNARSIHMFTKQLGFTLLQNTYELRV